MNQKSQKEIWKEKILNSAKPKDYQEIMNITKKIINADYRYQEGGKFYFLAENEAERSKGKQNANIAEIELFKLTNKQCLILIISKEYFND